MLGWNLTRSNHPDNWDVLWTDSTVPPCVLSAMKPYQKVNHFPGMYAIARKSNLCMNLNRMRKVFKQDYAFYPKTWFLPAESTHVKGDMLKNKDGTYIVKPEASSQGKGIFLVKEFSELNKVEHSVVQSYVENPLLIDGLKFDLRIYVLVTGCDPLRIHIYEDGLARFATEKYKAPSFSNMNITCMHLTNYAVNKKNSKFIANRSEGEDNVGHKRSLKALMQVLREQGHDVEGLWKNIQCIVIKTICVIQPSLAHTYKSCQPHDTTNAMCFEILGFDILIDEALRPWLLEINHSPAFSTESPLDRKIKRSLINDALLMLNLTPADKKNYEKQLKQEIKERTLLKKSFEQKQNERNVKRVKQQSERDRFETENSGRFTRIFPGMTDQYYCQFIDTARELWEDFTGSRPKKPLAAELRRNSTVQNRGTSIRENLKVFSKPATRVSKRNHRKLTGAELIKGSMTFY